MHIDRTHRGWLIGSSLATLAAVAAYTAHAILVSGGARGDSWVGLTLGILAAAMLFYAGFLGARKKVLLLRIGSVTWWMRGHLWLGAMSLPFALMHGAFAFGGMLTTVLMVLLIVVVISGVAGAALQHALPGVMTSQVTNEHAYEQHERLSWNLRREAYETVAKACGSIAAARPERDAIEAASGTAPREPKKTIEAEGQDALARLYVERVLPYLRSDHRNGFILADETASTLAFETLRTATDPTIHATVDDLASICAEARHQTRQARLHRWLHGWLLVHVPLSMALMALLAVHAVMALYY